MTALDPQLLTALMAAAILEEIIFRAGIHETLLRPGLAAWTHRCASAIPLSAANLVTALLFALAHGLLRSWILALAVVPAALLLGWLYERYRRVWPCIAVHALMNLTWYSGSRWLGEFVVF